MGTAAVSSPVWQLGLAIAILLVFAGIGAWWESGNRRVEAALRDEDDDT